MPAYRPPRPASTLIPPMEFPIASSVRESLRLPDPAGGPEWVLRSWRGRPDPRASYGQPSRLEFVCDQLGVLEGGKVVQTAPGIAGAAAAGPRIERPPRAAATNPGGSPSTLPWAKPSPS